jgi:succinate-semialdehyde dehydrogenase/glutarate-semialdehyde dehydrogenase
MQDERVRKLSFTGSTAVGKQLVAQASSQLLRLSMELGGNAPFIVLADADVDAAVDGAVQAKLRNGGEACTAANRFLVHRAVADAFTARLAARFAALVVGRGTDAVVDVGPLIDDGARMKVSSLVDEAVDAGAELVSRAEVSSDAGYFYPPTVLRLDGQPAARVLHEEIFGPIAPITVFDDVDEAIVSANSTEYGLVAYVYTENLRTALRVTEGLESGMVGINCGVVSNAAAPFGGVKRSGYGREGGREGIDDYLSLKYAAIAT